MKKNDFKAQVLSLLDKYNFNYNKVIARQRNNGDVDVWIYYTHYGYNDKFLINSWSSADKNGSVEWYIKQQAILEGFVDDYPEYECKTKEERNTKIQAWLDDNYKDNGLKQDYGTYNGKDAIYFFLDYKCKVVFTIAA